MMHVLDMWEEIMSHCDSISRVNLILSNKYLYDNFRGDLEKYKYGTYLLTSRSSRELNYFKDVALWRKIYNSVGINKVYMLCSKGGSIKKIWVNLSQADFVNFLLFLRGGISSSKSGFPDIETRMDINKLGRGYIQHLEYGGLTSLEWEDDVDGRVIFISMDKDKIWVNKIASVIEEKLCMDNENFDLDMYCSVKSRRSKRITLNKKNKMLRNNKCGLPLY